jgi:outer membrane protein OmpA-like peptidoglycan-associated protein/uncharacterized protein YegP (UPF0339 family)
MVNEDYLACSAYEGQSMHESEGNFSAFHDAESQQHFFALVDADGKVLLKSEGYPQPAARENGIQSVIKNRTNRDFYSVKEEDGTYYLSLRAGNYREIARSCNMGSEAEAMALIAYATGEQVRGGADASVHTEGDATALAATATATFAAFAAPADSEAVVETVAAETTTETVVSTAAPVETAAEAVVDVEDDYLPCRDYHGHETSPRNGFRTFFSEKSNKFYFAIVDAEGDVTLRSEGHLTAADRDEDMADVVKNMFKKERYNIKKVGFHHHFIVLRNENGKEIARSCAHDSMESVHSVAPFLNPDRPVAKVVVAAAAPVIATAISGAAAEPAASIIETVKISETVKGTPLATVVGTVAATVAATSMAAARPVIVETVETIQVVPPPPPPPPVVEAVVEAPKPVDVEDDYLPCKEYEGRTISDKANSVTMFKHDNGQFYFAIYNEDGSVRLRSEGFRTSQDRDKELSGALKNLNNADMYTTVRRGDYYMSILKDKTGREVGRSCLQKDEPTPVVAPVVVEETPIVAPVVAAAAIAAVAAAIPAIEMPKIEIPEVKIPELKVAAPAYVAPEIIEEVAEGGFKWWWLLLPLLALLAWWMFSKGCDKAVPAAPAATTIEAPKAAEPAATPAAAVPAAPSCDLNWILFDFDKADITAAAKAELAQMAKILKENKDYIGVLSAHTDGRGTDAYNDDLSLRRAAAAKRTLVAMGIEAGRLKTKADGKGAPVAENTQDDAGRQFNRRVELYIQDKDGKDICQSIAPNIPDALKTK